MTMPHVKKLLLFDIDGTLLQAQNAGRRSLAKAYRETFGLSDAIDAMEFRGRTDPELFQEAAMKLLGRRLDEADYARLIAAYFAILPQELESCVFTLKPGITDLLPKLAGLENVVIGIQTGNLETSAYMKLKRGGIDGYFTFGGFGSDHESRTEMVRIAIQKAHRLHNDGFSHEDIYVIGDTQHDIRAGKEAGARTIAVATGFVSEETLLAENPDYFFPDLSDIPAFLKCIDCEVS